MLTRKEIETIVNRDNLVIRNLQVTQGYYRMSQGMRKLVGSKNVSWCSFATHASKTAGQALRHELMPGPLKSAMIRLAGYENTFFFLDGMRGKREQALSSEKSLMAEALKRVSRLVSEGNVLVFAELAWPFACLVNNFKRDWEYDEGKLRAFLKTHFRPGPLEKGGQDYLIEAFTAYYKARFVTSSKPKAEYILQGNLLVGLHEQTRLQPHIERALAVLVDIFLEGDTPGNPLRKRAVALSRRLATRFVTQMLMSISLPSRDLKLGHNVVAPTGVHSFPTDLVTIEKRRVWALVQAFARRDDTLTGSAAENWASLRDRMSFVAGFFRSHQQYKRLFEQPFRDSQVPAIEAGHMPAGPL